VNVLVLDGNENQAVASVRSLARAGHTVWVGADAAWSKAGWSRHARGSVRYTAPRDDVAAFVDDVCAAVGRLSGALVLPMTERSTLPLSAHRARLAAAGGQLVLPPHETILRAFDKGETTRLANELGIATPHTAVLTSRTDALAFAETATFPAVLKPRASETANGNAIRTGGAPAYARVRQELVDQAERMIGQVGPVLAQEYVEGSGVGYFALMSNGELRCEFAHRRIRDVRPTGSGSSVRESTRPDPEVREAGLAILNALRWHGVAMVEFRKRPDGTPVFLEVNGRFWNSLALAIYAGADFPRLLADLAQHGDVAPSLDYQVGVQCRWLLGDARHLAAVLRGPPTTFTGRFPSRWRTLLAVFTPVPGMHHDNFVLDDPLPEVADWLDFLTRRVPRHLTPRRPAGDPPVAMRARG
jgi:predicted ATP-grasp superfamily ATP-dependent carboligase